MFNSQKKYLQLAALSLLVFAGLMVTWQWGGPVYRQHKETRSVTAAQLALAHGDLRNAWLGARVALQLNSNSIPACRIMAAVAEDAHSPAALDWRQRILELEPTLENKLALAAEALRFQNPPFPLTSQILDQLANTTTNEVAFQEVAVELALRMNRLADAENHLATAMRLAPTNKSFQLNLAVLHLNSTNPAVLQNARLTLDEFRADTNFGPVALRSLVADALIHDNPAMARDYSTQLLAMAASNLGDRLQYLGILKRLQNPDLPAQLKIVQQDAATNAMFAAQTAAWMAANGFREDTLNWLTALPAGVQNQTPVQVALADYYIGTTNWQGLFRLTGKGDWGEMNFLRLAFLSHAWNELGEPVAADANWHSAINQADRQLGALNALLELAQRWDMKAEAEHLLERIVQDFPQADWAWQNLERRLMMSGDTRKLYELYAQQVSRSPQNLMLKNNRVATALLLKTNLVDAEKSAAEIWTQAPGNPDVVSTYAYALHLQGRDQDGLDAFKKLTPAQLEQPDVALYYGVLLMAAGKNEEAATYFKIAKNGGHLLPEEKQLFIELGEVK